MAEKKDKCDTAKTPSAAADNKYPKRPSGRTYPRIQGRPSSRLSAVEGPGKDAGQGKVGLRVGNREARSHRMLTRVKRVRDLPQRLDDHPARSQASRNKRNDAEKALRHLWTYVGVFLFTLILYFRPYELITPLKDFKSMALVAALLTVVVYVVTQLNAGGPFSIVTTEIKCILFLAAMAMITIPFARDPGTAWEVYSDNFIKIIVIFLIMVNVLRTRARLVGLMSLSIGIGVWLGYQALMLYQNGILRTEGYRVRVSFGGMFVDSNNLALHLVVFAPLALVLGLASRNKFLKLIYFASASLMVGGCLVTQSRGGFLGLLAGSAVIVWKFGRRRPIKTILLASVLALLLVIVAPGNYGTRIMSIIDPSLDSYGSSLERRDVLERSIIVTLRNPLGIGIGNFPVVGIRNLQTHNAYTQVSSELGWLALIVYIILLISPFRKLGVLQNVASQSDDDLWFYFVSVGLQASIGGYVVASFFDSTAYQWYIYYPIAYAVCLRRIYPNAHASEGTLKESTSVVNFNRQQEAY